MFCCFFFFCVAWRGFFLLLFSIGSYSYINNGAGWNFCLTSCLQKYKELHKTYHRALKGSSAAQCNNWMKMKQQNQQFTTTDYIPKVLTKHTTENYVGSENCSPLQQKTLRLELWLELLVYSQVYTDWSWVGGTHIAQRTAEKYFN